MRDITAQLESYQDHVDALYPPVTAEEIYALKPVARRLVTPKPTLRPGLVVSAVAFAVTLGLVAIGLLLGGGGSTVPVGTVPSGPEPTLPAVSTTAIPAPSPTAPIPPTPSTKAPAVSTTAPIAAPSTIPATGSDAIPAGPLDPFAWQTRLAISPDSGLVAVYWYEPDHELRLFRCYDVDCTEPETVVLASVEPVVVDGEERGPYPEDIAFRADGSPIVLVRGGDAGEDFTLYACQDAACGSILAAPFDEGPQVREPRLAVASDGNPRILYYDVEDEALKLAVCGDAVCEAGARTTSTVHGGVLIPSQSSIRIETTGRTFLEYETDDESGLQARVAVCADDQCSGEPTIFTFDDATTPRTTGLDDERFLIWYRSGPDMLGEGDANDAAALAAWDLMVTECDTDRCAEAQRIDAGPKVLNAWRGWRDDLGLLPTSDTLFLVYSYWSSADSAMLLDATTVELRSGTIGTESGTHVIGSFTASVAADGEPLLLLQSPEGELRMINLNDGMAADAPSESGCDSP